MSASATNLADYYELQEAIIERLMVVSRRLYGTFNAYAWINPYVMKYDSTTGEISLNAETTMSGAGNLLVVSEATETFRNLSLLSPDDLHRPLRYSDAVNLDNLLRILENHSCNTSSAVWIDDAVAIEGQMDIMRFSGIPFNDPMGQTAAPYSWPEDFAKKSSYSYYYMSKYWLDKLGYTERPKPKRYVPDNQEWFDYARDFVKSLKKFIVPFNSSLSLMATCRSGSGGVIDGWSFISSGGHITGVAIGPKCSFSEAIAAAHEDMEDEAFYATSGLLSNCVAAESYAFVGNKTLHSADNAYGIGSVGGYVHEYSASIFEIKDIALLFTNNSDLEVDVELFTKNACNYHGKSYSDPRTPNVFYKWKTLDPFNLQGDGLFHKIAAVSGSVEAGKCLFKKIDGGVFEPEEPPVTSNITDYDEVEWWWQGYVSGPSIGRVPDGATYNKYSGTINSSSISYWVISPHFKHLSNQ
jgi:hypothetical protein